MYYYKVLEGEKGGPWTTRNFNLGGRASRMTEAELDKMLWVVTLSERVSRDLGIPEPPLFLVEEVPTKIDEDTFTHEGEVNGWCSHVNGKAEIYLRRDLSLDQLFHTLGHELFHSYQVACDVLIPGKATEQQERAATVYGDRVCRQYRKARTLEPCSICSQRLVDELNRQERAKEKARLEAATLAQNDETGEERAARAAWAAWYMNGGHAYYC